MDLIYLETSTRLWIKPFIKAHYNARGSPGKATATQRDLQARSKGEIQQHSSEEAGRQEGRGAPGLSLSPSLRAIRRLPSGASGTHEETQGVTEPTRALSARPQSRGSPPRPQGRPETTLGTALGKSLAGAVWLFRDRVREPDPRACFATAEAGTGQLAPAHAAGLLTQTPSGLLFNNTPLPAGPSAVLCVP